MARNLSDRLKSIPSISKQLPSAGGAKQPFEPEQNDALAKLLGGSLVQTDYGQVIVIEEIVHELPGGTRPDLVANTDFAGLAAFMRFNGLDRIHAGDMAFLDTETTGLSGGTGTLAFNIGIGRLEKQGFTVRQVFIQDYPAEKAGLHLVAKWLKSAKCIVSYNGRAFDMPLLLSRYRLNRMSEPARDMLHLDSLFPARRLYKARHGSCSLGNLENEILGVTRTEDIPGAEIPAAYFDFLTTGNTDAIRSICSHNRIDIASLAALTARIAATCADPDAHPEALIPLAIWHRNNRNRTEARKLFEKAFSKRDDLERDMLHTVLENLARLRASDGQKHEAYALWLELASDSRSHIPMVEIAKYLEHSRKNFPAALAAVKDAISKSSFLSARQRESLEHRRTRLEQKLQRPEKIRRRQDEYRAF